MIKLNKRDYITIIISIVIALTPLFFQLCLCLFIRYQIKKDMNRDNQNYIADCSEFGYYIRISEEGKQRDSLRFSFRKHSGELVCDDLLIRNSSWDVVSFVFVEGVDSVYIRDFPHLYERFSPEEKEKYINEPEGYKEEVSIIGALPQYAGLSPIQILYFLFMTEITIILINPKTIISILSNYGIMLKERMCISSWI